MFSLLVTWVSLSNLCKIFLFFSDPSKPGPMGSDLWVRMSLRKRPCADLTYVTLADEDTNSIITDNANRAIQGNVAMQVTQPGGQLCKQCKWRH